jgi:hypothetical protein
VAISSSAQTASCSARCDGEPRRIGQPRRVDPGPGRSRIGYGGSGRTLAIAALIVVQGSSDPSPGDLIVTVEALGVDAQEHLDTMASPLGDLGGCYSPVEPGG